MHLFSNEIFKYPQRTTVNSTCCRFDFAIEKGMPEYHRQSSQKVYNNVAM